MHATTSCGRLCEDCTLEQFASTVSQHEVDPGSSPVPQHDHRSTLRLLVSVHTVILCDFAHVSLTPAFSLGFLDGLDLRYMSVFLDSPATSESFIRTSAGAAQPAASTVSESMAHPTAVKVRSTLQMRGSC